MQSMNVKGQTFIVDVKYSQYSTLQGTVLWVQKNKKMPFRSAMEMAKLIDSVMQSKDAQNENEEILDLEILRQNVLLEKL